MRRAFSNLDSVMALIDLLKQRGSKHTWHRLVVIAIDLLKLKDQTSALNVNSEQARRLNLERNVVLALLFIQLHCTREENVLTLV